VLDVANVGAEEDLSSCRGICSSLHLTSMRRESTNLTFVIPTGA
jgi:hypothetical protein